MSVAAPAVLTATEEPDVVGVFAVTGAGTVVAVTEFEAEDANEVPLAFVAVMVYV